MVKLPGNVQLTSDGGRPLFSLADVNALPHSEKRRIYLSLLPPRLLEVAGIDPEMRESCCKGINLIAPDGLGLLRLEVRRDHGDRDSIFFLDLMDTRFGQLELAFCTIVDPEAPRYDVDLDLSGCDNCFATAGRNVPEEIRAMHDGLFPNQTRRGLGLFAEFFPLLERFADSLEMDMIVAEPLTYDNAIRYEHYGFDYLTGRRLMLEINDGFKPGGVLHGRLDGSSPFRMPGMDRTVAGRSWAIHDGIMDEPWDNVLIYKMIGVNAGVDTFPERDREEKR